MDTPCSSTAFTSQSATAFTSQSATTFTSQPTASQSASTFTSQSATTFTSQSATSQPASTEPATTPTHDWHGNQEERGLDKLRELLAAAPALQVVEASVVCKWSSARALLRHEPPFQPLRLRCLDIDLNNHDRDVAALVADLSAHPSLTTLALSCHERTPLTRAELDAVATTAPAIRLPTLRLFECCLAPETVPALVRLLGSSALTELHIEQTETWSSLLDEHSAALLAEALHANRTLRRLTLRAVLWNDARREASFLEGLVGHPSLCSLNISFNSLIHPNLEEQMLVDAAEAAVVVGAALGALVAADAPALQELHLTFMNLDDGGLFPLCQALPRNTHLRKLNVSHTRFTTEFAALRLLPAVQANNSLRELKARIHGDAAADAIAFVQRREDARVAAEAAPPGGA